MKKFKRTRKVLALLLSLSLITGMMPASALSAFAATEKSPVDAAIIFTDLHTNAIDYKESTVKGIFTALKNSGLPFSSVTCGGDAFSVNGDNDGSINGKYTGKTSTINGYIRTALEDSDMPISYVWSDHDRYALQEDDKTLLDKTSHLSYGAGKDNVYGTDDDDNYYVYNLSMADLGSFDRYSAGFNRGKSDHGFTETVDKAIENFNADTAMLNKDRPLLIVSHQPLFDRRDDNAFAEQWFDAINEVAEEMDVAYFFGHNHNYDEENDYYYAKGSTIPVATKNGWNGYEVEQGWKPQSQLASVTKTLNFTHMCAGYTSPETKGSTTRTGTVMAVSIYDDSMNFTTYCATGEYKGNYAVNETVERGFAGKESVGDGEITPNPPEDDVTTGTATNEEFNTTISAPGITGVAVSKDSTNPDKKLYKAYAKYDIVPEGYTQGDEATVSIKLDKSFSANGTVLVYDVEKGTHSAHDVKDYVVTFKTNHFSEYIVVEVVNSNAAEDTGTINDTTISLVNSIDGNGYYFIANNRQADNNILTSEKYSTRNSLALVGDRDDLSKASIRDNNVWYISSTSNGYNIRLKDIGGSYLNFANGNATLSNTEQTFRLSYVDGTWRIYREVYGDDIYLNDYNNEPNAAGWQTWDTNNNGNKWRLYKITENNIPVSLSVTPSAIKMNPSENDSTTYKLSPVVKFDGSTTNGYKISYTSNDTAVAEVNNDGVITGHGNGKATITATLTEVNGRTLSTPLSVTVDVEVDDVTVETVKINNKEGSVARGSEDDALTGSRLTVTYSNGKKETVDVTLGMISGNFDKATNGTYEGLTVTYKGQAVTSDDYTLVVEDKYDIEILHASTQQNVDRALVVKNVQADTEYELDYELKLNGAVQSEVEASKVSWISSNEEIAKVDVTGKVVFTGEEGLVRITATYTVSENVYVTDVITISVSKSTYMVPEDGTNDFPEYPNEGSIRFDKTATAVGNFSETGIAQLELSMTGVPFTSGNTLDVVLMLDRSNSMTDDRLKATKAAVEVFVKNIAKNEDGTFTGNRIFIGGFMGGNPAFSGERHQFQITDYTEDETKGFQVINSDSELNELIQKVNNGFTNLGANAHPYGTEYAQSLAYCYNLLKDVKADGNSQTCVFMSDGIPNVYQYGATQNDRITSSEDMAAMFSGSDLASRDTNYKYEYFSSLMKQNGVTVYSVGLGLYGKNSSLGNQYSEAQCENVSNKLLNDISGPAYEAESARDTGSNISKLNKYFYSVQDSNAASGMKDVFDEISKKLLDAAKNVRVTDKISNNYTMIFDLPTGDDDISDKVPEGQEFYMEVVDYTLKEVVENGKIVDYERVAETSLMKLYIAENSGNLYAASNASGTPFAAPTYAAVIEGQNGYYNLVDGEYVFVEDGTGAYNMVSGAVVTGTSNDDLVISTPYVHYDANTRILVWTTERLRSSELALRYFLYLDKSAAELPENQVDAGTYPTNDYATLDYTNFNGNSCQQIFPVPQMTWNGAHVSYVFYLVNEDGQPVNRAGRVIPFSEAVYVTDTFTHAVTWNKDDASGRLEAQYLASERVPSVYELYDEYAGYEIYVYEDENAVNKDNRFKITAGNSAAVDTTYVFNTKSDKDKYRAPGTYGEGDVHTGFDFSNTTVAFAVLWKPELAEDTVVIDYGLPVDVDVARNDAVSGAVTGIFGSNNAGVLLDYEINKGQLVNYMRFATELEPGISGLKYGKAEIINDTTVRYTPSTMKMPEEEKFYYVTSLKYYQEDTLMASRMYSSVTVIPATTVYYEDSFVDFKVYDKTDDKWSLNEKADWDTAGETVNSLQDTDRPGESKLAGLYDADNVYGYDGAYDNMSTYSLGSARKITVDKNRYGTATFEFYGTGFDVIALTSNNTGTITVKTEKLNDDGTVASKKNYVVDTYYGYTKTDDGQWVVDPDASNSLYQVPVIEASNIGGYGHYRVTIKAAYNDMLNHTSNQSEYDLFIDAIRIYDPANGGEGNEVIAEAYVQDGEYQPEYVEVRNLLIEAATFDELDDSASVNGIMFIDGVASTTSISDYKSYGPNNEVYLKSGQSIIFDIPDRTNVKDIQIGLKSADGNPVDYFISGKTGTLNTSTGMYYSILEQSDGTIVVENRSGNGSILSVTDIKFTKDPYAIGDALEPVSMIYSSRSTLSNAKKITAEDPKVYSVKADKETYVPGETVVVTVTTNKATTDVTVNGEKITKFTEADNARIWTFIQATDKAEKIDYTAVAYNSLGETAKGKKLTVVVEDPKPETPVVPDTPAAPEKPDVPAKPEVDKPSVEKPAKPTVAPAKVTSVKTDKKTYTQGDNVKVTVTTNNEATKVKIGTKTLKTFKTVKGKKTWTTTVKASKIGKLSIGAVAYNKKGTASKKVTKTVTVKQFAPKKFATTLSKSKVKKGAKYTVTVKTSTDVKYVKVNGKKITKYTTDKKKTTKTFKITYKATKVGKKTVKVVTYNKAGYASKAKSKTVTVKRK